MGDEGRCLCAQGWEVRGMWHCATEEVDKGNMMMVVQGWGMGDGIGWEKEGWERRGRQGEVF